MSHYISEWQGFLVGLGKRSATTLCGLTLDQVEDRGDGRANPCTCRECRRINGDDR